MRNIYKITTVVLVILYVVLFIIFTNIYKSLEANISDIEYVSSINKENLITVEHNMINQIKIAKTSILRP